MDIDLNDDERALLDQIAPETTLDQLGAGVDPRRAAAAPEDEDDILDDGEEPKPTDTPAGFVSKAEYDRLNGEIDGLRKLFTQREAPQLFTPAAPAPAAPAAPAAPPQLSAEQLKAQREDLQAKFFEDPIGFANAIAQNAIAQERATNEKRHVETTASIARTEVSRIRDEVARDFPQYKSALPAMDQLMKETAPETLTALMASGKLRDVYMDNFKSKAFDVANRVNSAAIARRRPAAEEPPQLGARGLASVSSIDKVRSGNKQIRLSELDDIDREAVAQWRKLGWKDHEIAAELRKTS